MSCRDSLLAVFACFFVCVAQVMPLIKSLPVFRGDVIEVQSLIERQKENQRMLLSLIHI